MFSFYTRSCQKGKASRLRRYCSTFRFVYSFLVCFLLGDDFTDHFLFGLQKKRTDSQNAGLFINRARENYPEKMRVGNCDFLGLNLEIPQSKAAARTPIYTAHNLDDDDDQVNQGQPSFSSVLCSVERD